MTAMFVRIATGVVLLTVLVLPQALGAGQNDASPTKTTQTLTGWIHTGDAESTYKLATKDGVWNLSDPSHKLKLGRVLNHTVTVRGKVGEPFDTKSTDKKSNRLGILEVSKITRTGNSCRD